MIKVLISRGSYMRPDSHLNMGGVMEQGKSKRNKKKKKKRSPLCCQLGLKKSSKASSDWNHVLLRLERLMWPVPYKLSKFQRFNTNFASVGLKKKLQFYYIYLKVHFITFILLHIILRQSSSLFLISVYCMNNNNMFLVFN